MRIFAAFVFVTTLFSTGARAQAVPAISLRNLAPELAGRSVSVFPVTARAATMSGTGQLPIIFQVLAAPRTVVLGAGGALQLDAIAAPRYGLAVMNYFVFAVHARDPAQVYLKNPDGAVVSDPRCPNRDCSAIPPLWAKHDRIFFLSLAELQALADGTGTAQVDALHSGNR